MQTCPARKRHRRCAVTVGGFSPNPFGTVRFSKPKRPLSVFRHALYRRFHPVQRRKRVATCADPP
eukprot:8438896-Pyramimonas_sp.AAC.1